MTTAPQCCYFGKPGVNHCPLPLPGLLSLDYVKELSLKPLWAVPWSLLPREGSPAPTPQLAGPHSLCGGFWPGSPGPLSGCGPLSSGIRTEAAEVVLKHHHHHLVFSVPCHPRLLSVLRPGFLTHRAAQNQSKLTWKVSSDGVLWAPISSWSSKTSTARFRRHGNTTDNCFRVLRAPLLTANPSRPSPPTPALQLCLLAHQG